MKRTTMFLIASPVIGMAMGMLAFYQHIEADWESYARSAFTLSVLAEIWATRLSANKPWKGRISALANLIEGAMFVASFAGLTQLIAANPGDWLNICLKHWPLTVLPAAVIALLVLMVILEPLTPDTMRSGRKVPLTPFLDRE